MSKIIISMLQWKELWTKSVKFSVRYQDYNVYCEKQTYPLPAHSKIRWHLMFLLSAEERVRSQNCWVARSLSKTPDTFNLWLFHFKQYWWQLFPPPPFGTPFCCKLANCSPNDSFISIFILFVTEFFYITKTIITMISRKNCGYTKTALKK